MRVLMMQNSTGDAEWSMGVPFGVLSTFADALVFP